ncbi:hypothetical protein ABZ687_21425 [Streptomyces ardesiacus]|uniref:hypothetical protein n=1 Tax=Streptomyces ardesiacus TaxID=285564 RepID=UPI0033CB8879
MNLLSAAWWEEGSLPQFLIPLIVGVLVGVLGAWATLRAAHPKRVLNWWVLSDQPLLSHTVRSRDGSGLSIQFDSIPLDEPRIVTLALANQGRRDITAAMFHGGEALSFDLGGRVLAILDIEGTAGTTPPDAHHDQIVVIGHRVEAANWLKVKPSLFRRGQEAAITLLVDGSGEVKCLAAPLVDVNVTSRPPREVIANTFFGAVAMEVGRSARSLVGR